MKRIGIRELRQRASDYVRLAENGERIEITDRGRRVAMLGPLPTGSNRERLIAQGRLKVGGGNLGGIGAPLPARPGEPTLSEVLEELRRDER
jgi:prevent-host-death family protein